MPKLELELHTNMETLSPLRDSWNQLLRSSQSNNIFLTWEWVSTWWRVFCQGQRLAVIIAREADGSIVGIAPLKINYKKYKRFLAVRSVEFIGYGGEVIPEYLDFIILKGKEKICVKAFLKFILSCSDFWDLLYLTDMPEDSSGNGKLNS